MQGCHLIRLTAEKEGEQRHTKSVMIPRTDSEIDFKKVHI